MTRLLAPEPLIASSSAMVMPSSLAMFRTNGEKNLPLEEMRDTGSLEAATGAGVEVRVVDTAGDDAAIVLAVSGVAGFAVSGFAVSPSTAMSAITSPT